jgi:hypothetical protein
MVNTGNTVFRTFSTTDSRIFIVTTLQKGERYSSLLLNAQSSSEAHTSSYSIGTGVLSRG